MSLEHSAAHEGKASTQVAPADVAVYVNEREASKILDVSPRRLQSWRVSGSGPAFHKFGQAVRYRLSDLLAWAEAQCRRSTSEPA